jgi:hypothetical protein
MPAPTATEIYLQVKAEQPPGWRRFTLDHAKRVSKALERGSCVGSVNHDGHPTGPSDLSQDELHRLAYDVRTNNGAVGFAGSLIFTWLAWKLVETAVWWAIKWAWRRQWGLDEG